MIPPVLFTIFNRPDLAGESFESIRKARPRDLFIAADGPRPNRPDEPGLCRETRKVVERVDWECNLKTLFREQNLGCRKAMSGAISWFFEHVEEGIILEDDCVADETFFPFCQEMLERYRDDERIMAIIGERYGNQELWARRASYGFSGYTLFCGWATWRRAWAKYDDDLDDLDTHTGDQWLLPYLGHPHVADYWKGQLKLARDGTNDTWGYRWLVSFWRNHGLSIVPSQNMITNIGCDSRGTHTRISDWVVANRPRGPLRFPLTHPQDVKRDYLLDRALNLERYEISLAPRRPSSRDLVRTIVASSRELAARAGRRIRRSFRTPRK
ncbi:hypothetical protein GC207_14425 [bacterium]|nr:hypothetical protein [bacterium]